MPTITIGNTSKRINSTSQSFSGTSLSCKLKLPCSMQRPTFEVSGLTKGNLYNYCSFEGRYYWIDDITYITNDIQLVQCHLDPLATYKSAIQSTSALVAYSNSSYWNQYVDDVRFSPEVWVGTSQKVVSLFPFEPSAEGCVVLTFAQTASIDWILNLSTTTPCGIHVAVMTMAEFRAAFGDLIRFGDTVPPSTSVGSIGEACAEIVQAFARSIESTGGGSFLDNIKRCIWLPFTLSSIVNGLGATARTGLMIGGVMASNCNWYEITQSRIYLKSDSITFDTINSLTYNLKFLRNERFCGIQVVAPGGYNALPNDKMFYPIDEELTYYYRSALCLDDGSWAVNICSNNQHRDVLQAFSGRLGVNLLGDIYGGPTTSSRIGDAIVGLTKTALSMGLSSMASGIGGHGLDSGMAISGAERDMLTKANEMQIWQLGSGIKGSLSQTGKFTSVPCGDFAGNSVGMFVNGYGDNPTSTANVYFTVKVWAPKMIADDSTKYIDYCNKYGYPCNKYLSLSNYSGFVQCAGASVQNATGASEAAKATINSYLNSGIYIE